MRKIMCCETDKRKNYVSNIFAYASTINIYLPLLAFSPFIFYTVNTRSLLPVERYSESESQIGNSGSEDNCNFGNSNAIPSSNNKEASGKNHTSIQIGHVQNSTLNSSDNASIQFTNGSMSNGNLEHITTPVKECHSNSKDSNKNKSGNSAKKNSNKRARNR